MTVISSTPFGTSTDGKAVNLFTLKNKNGCEVSVCSYGATVVSIKVPDRNGNFADVVLGYDDLAGYETKKYYFGAAIGRCGNRIGRGQFELNGKKYQLNCNDGKNHLHGGFKGFNDKVWDCIVEKDTTGDILVLRTSSPDGEENYPGNMNVTITYSFSDDNEFAINYKAVSDADTVCNLTNHAYFNLGGHNSGDVYGHKVKLYADTFTETDNESIPTGRVLPVEGTPMDFKDFHAVGERIDTDYYQLIGAGGYDHNWVINKSNAKLKPFAEVIEEKSGRRMSGYTTSPCVQLYCGNYIDGTQPGKGGFKYAKRAGLCLETQFAPDAINHPEWDSPILRAGETYDETTVYKFDTI